MTLEFQQSFNIYAEQSFDPGKTDCQRNHYKPKITVIFVPLSGCKLWTILFSFFENVYLVTHFLKKDAVKEWSSSCQYVTTKRTFAVQLAAAASSNGNGEFGDWNAFSASPPASSSSGPSQPVADLFGSVQSPTAPTSSTTSIPPSAELLDLMSGVNNQITSPHTTLSASQSLTFSLGGVTPGASGGLPTMPLSRSQQVGAVTRWSHFSHEIK